jgi:hypothetical protein
MSKQASVSSHEGGDDEEPPPNRRAAPEGVFIANHCAQTLAVCRHGYTPECSLGEERDELSLDDREVVHCTERCLWLEILGIWYVARLVDTISHRMQPLYRLSGGGRCGGRDTRGWRSHAGLRSAAPVRRKRLSALSVEKLTESLGGGTQKRCPQLGKEIGDDLYFKQNLLADVPNNVGATRHSDEAMMGLDGYHAQPEDPKVTENERHGRIRFNLAKGALNCLSEQKSTRNILTSAADNVHMWKVRNIKFLQFTRTEAAGRDQGLDTVLGQRAATAQIEEEGPDSELATCDSVKLRVHLVCHGSTLKLVFLDAEFLKASARRPL